VAPLVAVGWEGFFGFITILIFIPILAIPSISSKSSYFDLPRGWHQMIDTPTVLWSGVAIAFSIALFNYFGLSVTRYVSATARSLTDTCRTLTIWLISLGLGWEKLFWPISLLQVLGFALLVYGTVCLLKHLTVYSFVEHSTSSSSPSITSYHPLLAFLDPELSTMPRIGMKKHKACCPLRSMKPLLCRLI
jgi:hypothetical protein